MALPRLVSFSPSRAVSSPLAIAAAMSPPTIASIHLAPASAMHSVSRLAAAGGLASPLAVVPTSGGPLPVALAPVCQAPSNGGGGGGGGGGGTCSSQAAAPACCAPPTCCCACCCAPACCAPGFGADGSKTFPLALYVQDNRLSCVTLNPYTMQPLRTSIPLPPPEWSNGVLMAGENETTEAIVNAAKGRLMTVCNIEAMKQAAESLVIRARAGDQNAVAMIRRVSANAPTSQRATAAWQCIQQYIAAHPVDDFGQDAYQQMGGNRALYRASRNMADGPKLTRGHVRNIFQTFGGRNSRQAKLMGIGMSRFGEEQALERFKQTLQHPYDRALVDLGQTVGRARALQLCRMGHLKALSPRAAWELGY